MLLKSTKRCHGQRKKKKKKKTVCFVFHHIAVMLRLADFSFHSPLHSLPNIQKKRKALSLSREKTVYIDQ